MGDLGAYLIRAPKGGPFSFQQRCLWVLRSHYVEMIDKMIDKYTMEYLDGVINEIQLSIFSSLFNLPTELVQRVIDHVCSAENPSVHFALVLALLSLPEPRHHHLTVRLALPEDMRLDVFLQWLPRIGPGLTHLYVPQFGHLFDDDILMALSNTPSAGTLKTLDATTVGVTESSATAWHRFTSLEELKLSDLASTGYKTLMALSSLPLLRSLSASNGFGNKPLTIEQLEDAFGSNRFPQLERLEINLELLLDVPKSRKRVLDLFKTRQKLCSLSIGAKAENTELIEIHAALPHLVSVDSAEFISAETALTILPNIRNFLQLYIHDDGKITQDTLYSIAQCCPSLTELSIESHYESGPLFSDFSMFSSLNALDVIGHNGHKVTKFPSTLTSLVVLDFGNRVTVSKEEDGRRFMAAVCGLTNLKRLSIGLNAPAISLSSFSQLTRTLTRLQALTIRKKSLVVAEPTEVPLNNMPYLSYVLLDIRNLFASDLYLPALRSAPASSYPFMRKVVPTQLPNLDAIESNEYRPAPQSSDLILSFGPQLRQFQGSMFDGYVAAICGWSNLEVLHLKSTIPSDSARELLLHLGRLRHFDATIKLTSSDLSWMQHPKLAVCRLTLQSSGSAAEPILAFNAAMVPSLLSLYVYLSDSKKASVQISGLKNLRSLQLLARSFGPSKSLISFCASSCPNLFTVRCQDIEFTSFQVVDAKLRKGLLTRVSFHGADTDCSSLADLLDQATKAQGNLDMQ